MSMKTMQVFIAFNPQNGAATQFMASPKEPLCMYLFNRICNDLGYVPTIRADFGKVFHIFEEGFRFHVGLNGNAYVVGDDPWTMPNDENPDQGTFDQMLTGQEEKAESSGVEVPEPHPSIVKLPVPKNPTPEQQGDDAARSYTEPGTDEFTDEENPA